MEHKFLHNAMDHAIARRGVRVEATGQADEERQQLAQQHVENGYLIVTDGEKARAIIAGRALLVPGSLKQVGSPRLLLSEFGYPGTFRSDGTNSELA